MPHVIIKLFPGRSEQQKKQLAKRITRDVVAIANCRERSVSVSFEEVDEDRWAEDVYRKDILRKKPQLYKRPGYNPFS